MFLIINLIVNRSSDGELILVKKKNHHIKMLGYIVPQLYNSS
jgi:hypothetical protein